MTTSDYFHYWFICWLPSWFSQKEWKMQQGDVFKQFLCLTNSPEPKIFTLLSHNTTRISKSSQFRSWNLGVLSIFAWKMINQLSKLLFNHWSFIHNKLWSHASGQIGGAPSVYKHNWGKHGSINWMFSLSIYLEVMISSCCVFFYLNFKWNK